MRRVGIDEPERRAHSYPHQLSGGQRQRAMIAMALACNPKLLIADEPTTALDVTIRLQILELLERLRAEAGMALLLITHDLNLVRRFADRVAVMEKGVLVEQGTTAQVIGRPQHPYTQKLVNSRPQRDGRAARAAAWSSAASGVHVHYPTRLPGIRGWFKSGQLHRGANRWISSSRRARRSASSANRARARRRSRSPCWAHGGAGRDPHRRARSWLGASVRSAAACARRSRSSSRTRCRRCRRG